MVHEDDEWIKSALSDDSAVAALLLLLHRSPAATPGPSASRLDWRVRQRRSSKGAVRSPEAPAPKKGSTPESTRASPTTPLSWSGATSSAGGAEEFEESSLLAAKLRSKVCSGPSTKTTTKRLRRKKTLVELQEEESSLLKEQRTLRQELTNLQLLITKHRATNEKLKKLKVDMQESQATDARALRVSETEEAKSGAGAGAGAGGMIFELPDLNLPVEDS